MKSVTPVIREENHILNMKREREKTVCQPKSQNKATRCSVVGNGGFKVIPTQGNYAKETA